MLEESKILCTFLHIVLGFEAKNKIFLAFISKAFNSIFIIENFFQHRKKLLASFLWRNETSLTFPDLNVKGMWDSKSVDSL